MLRVGKSSRGRIWQHSSMVVPIHVTTPHGGRRWWHHHWRCWLVSLLLRQWWYHHLHCRLVSLLLRFSLLQLIDQLLQQVSVLLQSLLHTQRIHLCWWWLHKIIWLVWCRSWLLLLAVFFRYFFGCGGTAFFFRRAVAVAVAVAAACFCCLSEL